MQRMRCALCPRGPRGIAAATPRDSAKQDLCSLLTILCGAGARPGCTCPCWGSAPWHLSLLNCGHASTACCAPLDGKGHRQVLPAGRAEAACLAGHRWGLAGLQQGMGGSPWPRWAEGGRTWVFEGLVEGGWSSARAGDREKGLGRGPSVCGRTLPAWGFVARPAWLEAGVFVLRLT